MDIIAFQPELSPELPRLSKINGSKDYREFRAVLVEMNRILVKTGAEHQFILKHINNMDSELSGKSIQFHYRTSRLALRYSILLGITNESYRVLSRHVADSILFQWFTGTASVDKADPVSKSSIERFEKMFDKDDVKELIHNINRAAADKAMAKELLYRNTALKFDAIFADTTCVKANIHFPVDWVLLRDAVRTLVKAIIIIRNHGIKHRIKDPQFFLSEIYKLCMEMTQSRKKAGAKKMRKKTVRKMKALVKIVEQHANNYYHELEMRWRETDWSELEAQVVLNRIKNILDQLPQAVKQAHERIIGERRVANKDKILSFYDHDARVIVRGKSGAEVEFGNALYLAEQSDGLLVDWKSIREQPPADSKLAGESIERITAEYGDIESYAADRGFDSPGNRLDLEELGVINAICPRSVPLMIEKQGDDIFCCLQKRRAGTEARIGIFKNAYLGTPLRNKGFKNRQIRIEWSVLTHNLWKLAAMAAQRKEEIDAENTKAA
jgi:hypothetical protein